MSTRRNINREAVYTPPAFHPKALRLIFYLAGLLARFLFTAFPSRQERDSGRSVNSPGLSGMKLTATGIAPVLHRTSLLTPHMRRPDDANVKESLKRTRGILFFGCFIIIDGEPNKITCRRCCVIISAGSSIDIITETIFCIKGIVDTREKCHV